eukprot:CAMPEP_0171634822 /NCGR_PEP_ID=MMETSP0990-20121206/26206_1 /TAXON_ID=483369 /ORGANISM="non described non described, Strain CCMP2098" /LENGTH=185 /DNA_ID=CAMNT_0012206161 /DNA_START=80 /DNA_END=637 /DNA_ORIENTATION=+
MGAAASITEPMDETAATSFFGDKFNQAKFDELAVDGKVAVDKLQELLSVEVVASEPPAESPAICADASATTDIVVAVTFAAVESAVMVQAPVVGELPSPSTEVTEIAPVVGGLPLPTAEEKTVELVVPAPVVGGLPLPTAEEKTVELVVPAPVVSSLPSPSTVEVELVIPSPSAVTTKTVAATAE